MKGGKADIRENNQRLKQSQVYLNEEYERMNAASLSIQNTSEALKRTNNKYDGRLIKLANYQQNTPIKSGSLATWSERSKAERRRKNFGCVAPSMPS